MGYQAAQCMAASVESEGSDDDDDDEPPSEFGFELFAHITKFFGYKVYNLLFLSICFGNFTVKRLRYSVCGLRLTRSVKTAFEVFSLM